MLTYFSIHMLKRLDFAIVFFNLSNKLKVEVALCPRSAPQVLWSSESHPHPHTSSPSGQLCQRMKTDIFLLPQGKDLKVLHHFRLNLRGIWCGNPVQRFWGYVSGPIYLAGTPSHQNLNKNSGHWRTTKNCLSTCLHCSWKIRSV